MEKTDRELIAAYISGDLYALESLVHKYEKPLFGYITSMTSRGPDADDVFQEVWFRAIKSIKRYRHKNLQGWLMRIARNTVIDRVRRQKENVSLEMEREGGGSLEAIIAGVGPEPDHEMQSRELGGQIEAAVKSLPYEQKEVFVMRVQAGLPFKEIARVQGVSINTALARMQYALAKLQESLGVFYEEWR